MLERRTPEREVGGSILTVLYPSAAVGLDSEKRIFSERCEKSVKRGEKRQS